MTHVDLSRARRAPYKHQVVGVSWLIEDGPLPGCKFLADDMGAGKTKQVIDAAQWLFTQDEIDRVIVVAPAPVRSVWFDRETGELTKHLWVDLPAEVIEYHARKQKRTWLWTDGKHKRRLQWIITNYEFIRQSGRLENLLNVAGGRTLLVLDESSSVKNHRAAQSKACLALRRRCDRVWILNGTPISQSPGDLYSQANILNPKILACKNYFHFRARYAVMGGFMQRAIVSWRDLEDLQSRMAPFVMRRLKSECLDLPPKLDPITLTATLTPETWKVYVDLRDQLVSWLDQQTAAVAPQAGVKAMRLAQVTSGFVGGVQEIEEEESPIDSGLPPTMTIKALPPREIGREKLDVILNWVSERLSADSQLKMLLWCRFRPEAERIVKELTQPNTYTGLTVGALWGGQHRDDRTASLRLLDPDVAPEGPVVVVGTLGTGSVGLNLAASHEVVYCSNDYSLFKRLQSMDRVHRPGQRYPVSYFDVVAVGPAGQKTIDHAVVKALRAREELATWTTSAWVSALTEE